MNNKTTESELDMYGNQYIWTRYVMFALGFWLMVTPWTFAQHSMLVTFNNIFCGILVMILSFLSLKRNRAWAPWLICIIGIWLQFAPLLFWAPNAVGYLNDTSTGVLLILLSVIIPGIPGVIENKGGEIPPGWSYNPSSWNQRLPIILLTFFAWMSSRYMAAYQLGYIDYIWDPFFHDGTRSVITSPLSKSFPISDAGLGALVYTLEVLLGLKGSTRRWYTMPWIVFLFGIMVVPAGFVSILLIMLQPLIVGHWCTWCLITAVCMLIMIALTLDEVVAVLQYVKRAKGKRWKTFWKGGTYEEGPMDTRSPPMNRQVWRNIAAMFWGVTFPWNLVLSVIAGAALMFAPNYLNITPSIAPDDYIVGALVATFSFIAMAEVARSLRFVNIVLALWVIGFTLSNLSKENSFWIFHIVWGIVVIALNIPKGKIAERYGSWNRFIK